ncbi:UbiD family decarboxylase [Mesobacillus harenae]|uniref:UbiD family decarboxylase n=1 Tax=Mesobacillus harenae TaxID=2213203 RepID=UPI00157FCC4F|nr:UbiD family decarboxylase [Mesobacillus harenae]
MNQRSYADLREHIKALESHDQLIKISREINKDTEMHPLVRWQFRGGIKEEDRKAFLFENVTDSKGKKYDIPVIVGALSANREIYRLGLGGGDIDLKDINRIWSRAKTNPIDPKIVEEAPVHEIIIRGPDLEVPGNGLDGIPIPISTPGFDIAPFTTCSHFITKDPDSGIQNMGNYRGQVKSPVRLGMNASIELGQGIYEHWKKYQARGEKIPVAVVLGGPPSVAFAAVQKVPHGVDEITIAGGLVGHPINIVKCKTVDLFVPAESEIVIEGYINTEWLEPEAPFGESHGHVNLQEYNPFLEVTAITRRKDAILVSIISQVTPSESSLIKKIAYEASYLEFLRDTIGIKSVKRVVMHEPLTNLRKLIILQMGEAKEPDIWRALMATTSLQPASGKFIIAVDDDIDPDNLDAVFWAMSYRMKPHADVQIIHGTDGGHGPRASHGGPYDSVMLMNAMKKEPFPPVSLPTKEFMENAKEIWEELNLPPLKPEMPWYGYSLGIWHEKFQKDAEAATKSDYFETGKRLVNERRNDIMPNTEL